MSDDVDAAMRRQYEVEQFLVHEAELLDESRLEEWLGLVTDDVVYQVPVRINREQTGETRVTGVRTDSFHLDENRASLQMRVDRVATGFAWAEEPPSRLRHVIGNVRVAAPGEAVSEHLDLDALGDDDLVVRSNLLVFRSRGDRPEHDLLAAERHDVLRRVDGGFRLARRLVVLDSTVVPTLNLAFFF